METFPVTISSKNYIWEDFIHIVRDFLKIYYVYRLNFISNGTFRNSNHILSSFTEILILAIINFYYLTSFAMSDPVNTARSWIQIITQETTLKVCSSKKVSSLFGKKNKIQTLSSHKNMTYVINIFTLLFLIINIHYIQNNVTKCRKFSASDFYFKLLKC